MGWMAVAYAEQLCLSLPPDCFAVFAAAASSTVGASLANAAVLASGGA
jgi:hypothetical protein